MPGSSCTGTHRAGHSQGQLGAADTISSFRISPDATRVVVDFDDNARGGRSVWLVDVATGSRTRLTFGESDDWQPIRARDGEHILFGSYRDGPLDLYQRPASGATGDSVVIASEVQKDPSDWSRDGGTVLFNENTAEGRGDVVAVKIGTGTRTPIAATGAVELRGRFSPDDRWVAYTSDESGRVQVYVQPFPPTGRNGKSRSTAAASRAGGATDGSSTTSNPIGASWRCRWRRRESSAPVRPCSWCRHELR